jgi:hypothetical protein
MDMDKRAEALAQRVAQGHQELVKIIEGCSEAEWQTYSPNEGRPVGVLVHHVASMLPGEIDLVKVLASGQPITGVTMEMVDHINAEHADEHGQASREETLELLKRNSQMAVAAIRELTDEELDRAAPVSLHADAPLTTQYFIEDHPLGHSYHHLASIRAIIGGNSHS